MTNSRYTVTERTTFRRAGEAGQVSSVPDELLLPDAEFEAVKQLAATLPEADSLLTYSLHRNRETIRLRNYVGLLELRGGLAFDIQPRVGHLPTLLRYLTDPPLRYIHTAHSGPTPLPLWEVFIDAFLRETAQALAQGLASDYVAHEADLLVLRGKLRLAEQLRQHQTGRLAVRYDERTPDIAPNRLLKLALLHVQQRTRTTRNLTRCRQLLATLADVSVPSHGPGRPGPLASVLTELRTVGQRSRLLRTYASALRLAQWLLGELGTGLCEGPHVTTCLLFPIERLFEQYVAAGFRRVGAEVQSSSAHLIDEHEGQPRFKLRPDLILRRGEQTIVLDTKWKTINALDTNGHYGIEQADLYQLFAYGKKYKATDVVLIYPAHEQFQQPLRMFGYDDSLRLQVVPFNLDHPLMDEVETVLGYLSAGN